MSTCQSKVQRTSESVSSPFNSVENEGPNIFCQSELIRLVKVFRCRTTGILDSASSTRHPETYDHSENTEEKIIKNVGGAFFLSAFCNQVELT